jgi:MFS family permease
VGVRSLQKLHVAWWVLLGVCIVVGLGKAGINNASGLFIQPVAADLNIGVGSLTLYLSIAAIVTMISLPIGGKLMAKYDAKWVLIGAIILQAGSFALFGLMGSVWGWYILSIPLALGGAIITVIAGPVLIERWFIKKKGLALGILIAIGGLLGVAVQPLVAMIIEFQGWRMAYILTGVIVLVLVIPSILLLIYKDPASKNTKAYGAVKTKDEEIQENRENREEIKESLTGIPFNIAKKTPAFIYLTFFSS